jgi:lysophospholipase L1-like esterase
MGLASEKNIDDDPRPYVKAIRKFAAEKNVALADASLRWGRLWRRGIPYSTLHMNNINHPNPFGMGLFADALLELFP